MKLVSLLGKLSPSPLFGMLSGAPGLVFQTSLPSCFLPAISERNNDSLPNTLDEGAKIDPKIPFEDEEEYESLAPKSSEVKEEDDDDPTCFLPSIACFLSFSLNLSVSSIL